MNLYLYNTKTRKKEKFNPIDPPRVGLYTCGPTVYDYAHIGNLRSYIFADILRRTLTYNNYQVYHVMNITDVGHLLSDADEGEDKIMLGARREQKSPYDIADYYTRAFFKDTKRLNILEPSLTCRATDHIEEMIAFIQVLMDKGYAYETSDGIYFDISRFPNYGQLSGVNLEQQRQGARIEVNPEKKHPADFALWKKAPANHLMQWDSPWGRGFPGWHIECSAMALKYLKGFFDVHTGGIDHVPIHHENEIAQNWGYTGCDVVNYWLHGEFLLVDGGKMSKSLGNTYTLSDLEKKGYSPLAFRYLCLNAHYRKLANFTWGALDGAARALERLHTGVRRFKQAQNDAASPQTVDMVNEICREFNQAVNDDLNIPRAMALLWDVMRGEQPSAEFYELILAMDRVLGLGLDQVDVGDRKELSPELMAIIKERDEARKQKNWARADAIRDYLLEKGVRLIDTPAGVKWESLD